jgi:hypothetical protein
VIIKSTFFKFIVEVQHVDGSLRILRDTDSMATSLVMLSVDGTQTAQEKRKQPRRDAVSAGWKLCCVVRKLK